MGGLAEVTVIWNSAFVGTFEFVSVIYCVLNVNDRYRLMLTTRASVHGYLDSAAVFCVKVGASIVMDRSCSKAPKKS